MNSIQIEKNFRIKKNIYWQQESAIRYEKELVESQQFKEELGMVVFNHLILSTFTAR